MRILPGAKYKSNRNCLQTQIQMIWIDKKKSSFRKWILRDDFFV